MTNSPTEIAGSDEFHFQTSRRPARAGTSGFSLIEISLALLVISIGMIAIVGLFPTSLGMGKRAIDETYASFLADSAFASFKGAAPEYANDWLNLTNALPIAPNSVDYNQDVFWDVSGDLRIRADGLIHTQKYVAGSSDEKWAGDGVMILPNSWSMEDHALRYRISTAFDTAEPRIMQMIMEIWMGEFGNQNSTNAEVFYTEIFNHGK